MKQTSLFSFSAAVIFSTGTAVAAETAKANQLSRYAAMLDRSPFAVATPEAPADAAPPSVKDLFVASVACLDEECLVTLGSSSDRNFTQTFKARRADVITNPNTKLIP